MSDTQSKIEFISFSRFSTMSTKGKMQWLQTALKLLGYDVDITLKRDKKTVKALGAFQKANDITPNGVVCETTFDSILSMF